MAAVKKWRRPTFNQETTHTHFCWKNMTKWKKCPCDVFHHLELYQTKVMFTLVQLHMCMKERRCWEFFVPMCGCIGVCITLVQWYPKQQNARDGHFHFVIPPLKIIVLDYIKIIYHFHAHKHTHIIAVWLLYVYSTHFLLGTLLNKSDTVSFKVVILSKDDFCFVMCEIQLCVHASKLIIFLCFPHQFHNIHNQCMM